MSHCIDLRGGRIATGLLALLLLLSACSDIYYDRRETIAFGGGDAVATNRILQTADPWPPAAANRNLTYNGAVIGSAIERYRTGQVIRPVGLGTTSDSGAQQQQQPPTPTAVPVIVAPSAAPK